LAPRTVSEAEVLRAWAMHRALILAEVHDPDLANNEAHQFALVEARERFNRLFEELGGHN
jgi:hypothetical protein